MKQDWYAPIRLIPDNGILLKAYLWSLHLAAGAILYRLTPTEFFIPAVITLAAHLGYHLRRVLRFGPIRWVILQDPRRCILADPQLRTRDALLLSFRLIGSVAFFRIRLQDRMFSLRVWRGHQAPAQWHRLILMQRFGRYS